MTKTNINSKAPLCPGHHHQNSGRSDNHSDSELFDFSMKQFSRLEYFQRLKWVGFNELWDESSEHSLFYDFGIWRDLGDAPFLVGKPFCRKLLFDLQNGESFLS